MAYTSHGHVIPGLAHMPGAEFDGQVARCGGPGMCEVCSIEAIQAQQEAHLFTTNQIVISSAIYSEVTHNEETMIKVFGALLGTGMQGDEVLNCVMAMQNAGILFREVK
jgi:hypothetical protein